MNTKFIIAIVISHFTVATVFSQYTTGLVMYGPNTKIQIDTNSTTVTLTLQGPDNKWFGIGFGGNSMLTTQDMFIWNDTTNRDYTTNTVGNFGHNVPVADNDQSWTIISDNVSTSLRTLVATRSLVSSGDYTFQNNNTYLQLIFAQGATTSLAYHDTNPHGQAAISRFLLTLENPSQTDVSIYPNPSTEKFVVKTKTGLDKIVVYNQLGDIVKTIALDGQKTENEVDANGLATGVYIFELHNGNNKFWKKVVVE